MSLGVLKPDANGVMLNGVGFVEGAEGKLSGIIEYTMILAKETKKLGERCIQINNISLPYVFSRWLWGDVRTPTRLDYRRMGPLSESLYRPAVFLRIYES